MNENIGKAFADMARGAKNAITKVILKDQLVKDTAERYGLSPEDDIEAFMKECYQKEKSKEYLVDGAILTCTNCTKKDVSILIDGKKYIYHAKENEGVCVEDVVKYDELKIYGKLEVGENIDANVEGLSYATTEDFVKEKNIPYFGNCLNSPYSEEEKNTFSKNHMGGNENESACAEGSCRYLMKLNEGWENYEIDVDFYSFVDDACGKKSGITMTSILFCKHGGFIYPVTSGQNMDMLEDLWEDYELDLLSRFGQDLEYENWSDSKKKCAQELWKRFYIEEGKDAYFVAGLIGNMYAEANCGQLEWKDWRAYTDSNGNPIGGEFGGFISNIDQARVACLNSPSNYGVGMIQWSDMGRKALLLQNYELVKSVDGSLSESQLIIAECKTIKEELEGGYTNVCDTYQEIVQEIDSISDRIILSTCVFFRIYEIPASFRDVDSDKFCIVEGVWDKAKNANNIDKVPSICQRDVAAKVAYEEFMR
ncbi:MAG: DUF4280 domain-containing protein [Lachnospiraceae bacterium]|nr:DUF4280 domain-containing protein [Lachnospiraceae bacterium]